MTSKDLEKQNKIYLQVYLCQNKEQIYTTRHDEVQQNTRYSTHINKYKCRWVPGQPSQESDIGYGLHHMGFSQHTDTGYGLHYMGSDSCQRKQILYKMPRPALFKGYRDSFPRSKWTRCEGNHSPTSRTEVKNEWSYTSNLPLCLCGMHMDNSTFLCFKHITLPSLLIQTACTV